MIRARIFAPGITLGMLSASALFAPLAAQNLAEGPDFQAHRQAWFNDQRAYPNREVNWEAMIRTRQQFLASGAPRGLASVLSLSSGSWTPMGPYGLFGIGYWDSGPQLDDGRIDAIALHPTATGTMLIASPNGGIWRTTSGGAGWSPQFDTQCTLQMSTVKIDPVNPNIVYAASANASGAAGCALFRSTDGGVTWANWNGGLGFAAYVGSYYINEFFIDPVSAGSTTSTTLMFNYETAGIYRSTNSGQSWTHTLTNGYVTSIVALPGQPGTVFAGVADYTASSSAASGLYRSTDNGVTWTQLLSGGSYLTAARFQLATSAAQPNSVWIIAGEKARTLGPLIRWDNATASFSVLAAGGIDLSQNGRTHFGSQADYDLDIAVDPTNASRLYIAGVRGFKSADGGATFTPMGTEIHCDWHTIVIDPHNPKQLYAGTDGGIFSSSDGGGSWTSRNAGLVVSMYTPGISQNPTDPSIVLGGTQDNGSIISNTSQWYSAVSGGDGGATAINPQSPTTLWTTYVWQAGVGMPIYRTTPAGTQIRNSGIVIADRGLFYPPFIIDPVTPTTLYFGTMRLYKTVNEGASWTPVSIDLTKGTGYIQTIAVAQSDPQTVYVGTSDGNVQVSRNGGSSWILSVSGLPNRAITRFAIDRTNPARALVTLSGQGASHIYITTNAGGTWTSANGNLPDMPANAVVMIDDGTNHFFVGTDVGVLETTDAGATWNIAPTGLPNVVVNDLSYSTTTKQLVVATYGRGLYKYSLANAAAALRGDVNRDGAVNALDALLIQQALVGTAVPAGLTILPQGDANCDGRVDASDALIVLRASVGLTTTGACVGTVR